MEFIGSLWNTWPGTEKVKKTIWRQGSIYFRVATVTAKGLKVPVSLPLTLVPGHRDENEDAHHVEVNITDNHPEAAFLGIFDGHQGFLEPSPRPE